MPVKKYASSLTQLRLEFNFNAVTQQTSVAATQDAVQQLCSDLRNCCNVETNANVVCSEDTNARGLEPTSTATTTATLSLADPSELPRPSGAYISWEEYFMAVAFLSARRSKDPAVQVFLHKRVT
ncbi:hypothetical protein HAZT_HAZT001436 [Hyalella azteca]|uniref:Uncharacterized protein n=1 Tax=Hyalella azteca TaxID=294128 RepID=A0A6A0GX19_HYAAZ|nr:hypothetical protein HAZT_HAZT001436 [Hyalella azteca]